MLKSTDLSDEILKQSAAGLLMIDALTEFEFLRDIFDPLQLFIKQDFSENYEKIKRESGSMAKKPLI